MGRLKSPRRRAALPLVVLLLVALLARCGGSTRSASRGHLRGSIAAVIKGLDNPFFVTMKDGLEAAARQRGIAISVDEAIGLQDTTGQAAALTSLASRQAGCYVVNPIAQANLVQPLAQIPAGTPIVNIDSPVDQHAAGAEGVKITTYIGTDNVAAGRLAADATAGFVGRGAAVVLVTGIPGDATSAARAQGFTDGVKGRFRIVQSVAADFDEQKARHAAAQILAATPPVQGLFAVNDQMALGIAQAVRDARKQGKVAVIGLDGIPEALTAIRRGAMSATVAQYPYTIGQLGVEACLAAMRGKAVPAKIDAPVQVVTRSNVARAQQEFPRPLAPFADPLARLVGH